VRIALVIALAVLGVIIATALAPSGSHASNGTNGSNGSKGGRKQGAAQTGGAGAGAGPGAADLGLAASAGAAAPTGIPAGYALYHDPQFHFTMALPDGWHRIATAGQNSGEVFAASAGGYPRVQVDYSPTPGKDAAAAWRSLEPAVASSSSSYRGLGIHPISYRDFVTAADWSFTRSEGGTTMRVLDRGFADSRAGYAIMITCPDSQWTARGCAPLRETFFRTFEPVN
jgi:hypothetical protein